MKKYIILSISLFFVITIHAQKRNNESIKGNGKMVVEERNTSDYDIINISGFFDVELVSGKEGTITIKGEENIIENIITEVNNGKLKIHFKKGINISKTKKILITVPFHNISEVSLTGSGDIITKSTIKTTDFKVAVSGSGDIEIEVEAKTVKASVTGSGDLKISGTTTDLNCKVSGSGDLYAFDLKAKNVEAEVSGSGDIKVHVDENLNARVNGSGGIKYKGNPTKEDTKVSGSGKISKALNNY